MARPGERVARGIEVLQGLIALVVLAAVAWFIWSFVITSGDDGSSDWCRIVANARDRVERGPHEGDFETLSVDLDEDIDRMRRTSNELPSDEEQGASAAIYVFIDARDAASAGDADAYNRVAAALPAHLDAIEGDPDC